ncbi:unnamed protein product [Urochloa humidicola]
MESSDPDFNPGLNFASKVWNLLGVPISSSSPDIGPSFWLLASIPRSRVKLTEENVGFLLQSVIGGIAKDFAVVEVENWIFKFSVSCKEVGLMIYKLGFFNCESFKIVFNLWNERGIQFAKEVLSKAQGTHFDWNRVSYRKGSSSLKDPFATHNFRGTVRKPLFGANQVPLGQLNPRSVPSRISAFKRLSVNSHWRPKAVHPHALPGMNTENFKFGFSIYWWYQFGLKSRAHE